MSESSHDPANNDAVPDYKSTIPKTPDDKAYTSTWAWVRYVVPTVLGLAADLWLKAWSFPDGVPATNMMYAGRNPGNKPWEVIPHVLGFTTTVNQGAVFGIGQGKVEWFLLLSIVALGIILWVFATSGASQRVVHIALGLITAGAIGNLYDRAVFHGVRDMLRFYVDWYPYIFNIADVLLCIGVPLLIVRWLFVQDSPGSNAKAAQPTPHQ